MELRPIEEAPTETDEYFLLYGPTRGEIYDEMLGPEFAVGYWHSTIGCWVCSPTEYYTVRIYPTHYMPLPKAPGEV